MKPIPFLVPAHVWIIPDFALNPGLMQTSKTTNTRTTGL